MQFDHVIPGQSEYAEARDASERSLRWLERCLREHRRLEEIEGEARGAADALPDRAGRRARGRCGATPRARSAR